MRRLSSLYKLAFYLEGVVPTADPVENLLGDNEE